MEIYEICYPHLNRNGEDEREQERRWKSTKSAAHI